MSRRARSAHRGSGCGAVLAALALRLKPAPMNTAARPNSRPRHRAVRICSMCTSSGSMNLLSPWPAGRVPTLSSVQPENYARPASFLWQPVRFDRFFGFSCLGLSDHCKERLQLALVTGRGVPAISGESPAPRSAFSRSQRRRQGSVTSRAHLPVRAHARNHRTIYLRCVLTDSIHALTGSARPRPPRYAGTRTCSGLSAPPRRVAPLPSCSSTAGSASSGLNAENHARLCG